MKRWRQILLGLIALALAPTLYASNPCTTGGAPIMRDGSGQGGTGLRPQDTDGTGQGGTGRSSGTPSDGDGSGSGGTGLMVEVEGVITGFASICVNGLELHYSPTTPVTLHGKMATPKDLAVGQVVRALAKGQGDQLAVQHVQVRHFLIATIQGVKPGGVLALGRAISLSPGAVLPSGLTPGVKVAVSGFAGARGHSVATRLDVVPGDTPDSLTGEVTRNAQGGFSIDGVALEGRMPKLEPGDTVRAEGRFAQGRMQITRIEREERIQPVDRVVIQGPIRHVDKSGLSIGGQRFLIDAQTHAKQALPRTGEWAKIDAVREGRQFHVREVETQARPGDKPDALLQRDDGATRRTGHDENAHKSEQADRPDTNAGHPNQAVERSEQSESRESPERTEKSGSPEKAERSEKTERPQAIEKPEKVERAEKAERTEKVEKIERPEKTERPETVERPERVERVETVERPERVERVEMVERPERVERPETVERPERVERSERPEHDD
ncbi:MAG: hypothetical protein Q8K57_05420 [Thiobacillus sp.]|nr:hypothetical protein [Thiobacillus sp.]